MKYIKGEIVFDTDMLDVTDPCYDKDVWCRSRVPIAAGKYIYEVKIKGNGPFGERVHELRLTKADTNGRLRLGQLVTTIGVDAGMAGFFEDKPDYDNETWNKICDYTFTGNKKCWVVDKSTPLGCVGVFSFSGYGDGEYGVYELIDRDGYRCGYLIRF